MQVTTYGNPHILCSCSQLQIDIASSMSNYFGCIANRKLNDVIFPATDWAERILAAWKQDMRRKVIIGRQVERKRVWLIGKSHFSLKPMYVSNPLGHRTTRRFKRNLTPTCIFAVGIVCKYFRAYGTGTSIPQSDGTFGVSNFEANVCPGTPRPLDHPNVQRYLQTPVHQLLLEKLLEASFRHKLWLKSDN